VKRTIILKAEDKDTTIKIICQINKSFIGFADPNDKAFQYTESFADKLVDLLREDFFASTIKRIKT